VKRSQFIFPALLCLLAFSSCTPIIYKHQQMLASCHTRDDVSHRIGLPDEKIQTKTTEEWLYNLDSNHDNAPITPLLVNDSLHNGKVINYDKYLKFTFDLQGNVIGYQSNVADPVKAIIRRYEHVTAGGIVAATLFLALIVYLTVITKSEPSF
jgi:hypothetical protein